MRKRKPIPFNVIVSNIGSKEFEPYDVMPYFIRCYDEVKKKPTCPKTFEECKAFIESKSLYRYWSRCQYEIILSDWPHSGKERKIDVHWQVMNNIDLITKVFMENLDIH